METRKNIRVNTKKEVENAISYISCISGKRVFSDFKGMITNGDKGVYVSYLRFGGKLSITLDYFENGEESLNYYQSQCSTYRGALIKIANYLNLK